jgi:uncharacterized membrane protein
MNTYAIVAALHVIAAVGGLGQISAVGVMTRRPEWASVPLMRHLFKSIGGTLIVMLLTGLALLWLSDWVYEHTWWFRISFILFLALGAFHGIAQATLKKIPESTSLSSAAQLPKLRTMTLLMNIALIVMVYLMEAKPF